MENAYNLFINKLFMKADLGKIPIAGTFEITPRCTLDCKMCYIHNQNKQNYKDTNGTNLT